MTGDELREAFAGLEPITEAAPLHTWPRHRLSIRRHVEQDKPEEFLSWSTIVATMFVGTGAAFTDRELIELSPRYLDILTEPCFGKPETMRAYALTSGNLIHQAYHLMQLEQSTGARVDQLERIIEFGGGYGAMVLLCRRLGFTGRYTIIDLPEFSLLQRYYLSNTGYLDKVELIDNYDGRKMAADLFVAIYSLSEVPIAYRLQVLSQIKAKYRFMAHQDLYTLPDGTLVDNWQQLEDVAARFKMTHWANPVMDGHFYLCS